MHNQHVGRVPMPVNHTVLLLLYDSSISYRTLDDAFFNLGAAEMNCPASVSIYNIPHSCGMYTPYRQN